VPPKELYYDYSDTTKHAFKRVITGWWAAATWSWRGNCPRYLPSDFKLKSLFGVAGTGRSTTTSSSRGTATPNAKLGVSGNHKELDGLFGAYRSRPFPMPGIP